MNVLVADVHLSKMSHGVRFPIYCLILVIIVDNLTPFIFDVHRGIDGKPEALNTFIAFKYVAGRQ